MALQPLYWTRVTPVAHYCMGGLAIDASARVQDGSGQPILGLFAAGEVAGALNSACLFLQGTNSAAIQGLHGTALSSACAACLLHGASNEPTLTAGCPACPGCRRHPWQQPAGGKFLAGLRCVWLHRGGSGSPARRAAGRSQPHLIPAATWHAEQLVSRAQ